MSIFSHLKISMVYMAIIEEKERALSKTRMIHYLFFFFGLFCKTEIFYMHLFFEFYMDGGKFIPSKLIFKRLATSPIVC